MTTSPSASRSGTRYNSLGDLNCRAVKKPARRPNKLDRVTSRLYPLFISLFVKLLCTYSVVKIESKKLDLTHL